MATLVTVVATLLVTCAALPVDQNTPSPEQTDSVGCVADVVEGKGDFKLQKKYYPVSNPGFYVRSVKLLKRTSFYRCEPKTVKYGVTADSYSWWVDKGCEGMFEILECPDINRPPPQAEEMAKIDINVVQAAEVPSYDVKQLDFRGIENRFHLYTAPGLAAAGDSYTVQIQEKQPAL